jgi:hypothetical protein
MLFRCYELKPLQRRSGVLFGSFLIVTMLTFALARAAAEHGSLSRPILHLIELFPAIPIAIMIFVVGSYLKRETDEFVRMLVTQSLLWGLGFSMVGDIVFGVIFEDFSAHGLAQIYNIDVFCITAMAALVLQLRRAQ